MLQVGRSRAAQVNELREVESPAAALITSEITAESTRAELAKEFSAQALASLTTEGPSAENLLASGQQFIAGEIVHRLAGLLGEARASSQELQTEEFTLRSRQIGNTAREAVYSDLSGQASTVELDRIAARASSQAEQELLASTLVEGLDAALERSAESSATNQPQQSQRRRAGIGTRVENLVLATSDYPLAEMYGPGFEMLAEIKAAPQTDPERSQEPQSLEDLVVPRGFNRQTVRLDQAAGPVALAPAVDYSSADLSTLSLNIPVSTAPGLRPELARAAREDSIAERTTRKAA
jgi:hypothetical protein